MSNQATPSTGRLSIRDNRLFETRKGNKAILVQLTPTMVKTLLLQSADRSEVEAFKDLEANFAHYVVSGHDANAAFDVIEKAAPEYAAYVTNFSGLLGRPHVQATYGTQISQCTCIVSMVSSTEACITMPIYLPSRESICKTEELADTYERLGGGESIAPTGRKRDHLDFTIQSAHNQIRVIKRLMRIPALADEIKNALAVRSTQLLKHLRRLEVIATLYVNKEAV